jgi:hypothetical protein
MVTPHYLLQKHGLGCHKARKAKKQAWSWGQAAGVNGALPWLGVDVPDCQSKSAAGHGEETRPGSEAEFTSKKQNEGGGPART